MKQITLAVALVVAATANALSLNNFARTTADSNEITDENLVESLLNSMIMTGTSEETSETAELTKTTEGDLLNSTELDDNTLSTSKTVESTKNTEGDLLITTELDDNSDAIEAVSAAAP